ncbi:MAG: ABC transporter permease [Micrococcales bacterium]|uniref:ABC transporter permease n=1 Tax=Phycicoccus sp. TaxID=1902410 RepID=UPI0019B69C99|nr:ABC transporter permease [Phycicoccus sp.]MBD3781638.1 ABC transporter permease [Micrococcales bacterium]HMM95468.1 ABC transporter permease [Phycicoccus sp.]
MIPAIRSELRKFFSTRLWWGMAIAIFVGGAAFAALFGFLLTSDAASAAQNGAPTGSPVQVASSVYTGGLSIGYLLLLTIGVLQIGSEYRHKTISGTFLATPKRLRAMLAKVVALLGIGAVYGLISLVGSVSVGAVVLGLRDRDAFPSGTIVRTLALSLLVLGLWALIGLGIGILIPNQVAALLIGVGVAWIVEPLIGVAMSFWEFGREHIAQFLPSRATNAIVDAVTSGPNEVRLEWWGGALTLTAYAVVLAGIGIWRTTRADIS